MGWVRGVYVPWSIRTFSFLRDGGGVGRGAGGSSLVGDISSFVALFRDR